MGLVAVASLAAAACSPGDDRASPTAASPARLQIAAAADLRYAMDELVEAFGTTNPGIVPEISYGSSGNFNAQIANGAPFDIFFSADAEYPRALEEQGLAPVGSTRLYAVGQIVVWVAAESPIDVEAPGLAALIDPTVERVAIANPEHAPYGRAAVSAMRAAGVYDAVEPRLVLGENISQTAQFVESGNADVGVIALSLALAPVLAERGRHAIIPIETYPRIEQGALILSAASDPEASRTFLNYVLSPAGREVLDRYGFLPPP